jgi:hypothetical protein
MILGSIRAQEAAMISSKAVDTQLKKLHFSRGWNRSEADELANIILPDEEIFECVNGWYEGGFALLCSTDVRVLLIDKKPFRFLNVEDVRFDTINQIDYSHRVFNASICITAGSKSLVFKSFNQPRLRKLISHVQHIMAEIKRGELPEKSKSQDVPKDFSEMDQQFRAYLLSQYEQHQSLRLQHEANLPPITLNDQQPETQPQPVMVIQNADEVRSPQVDTTPTFNTSSTDLYQDGVNEIFGKYQSASNTSPVKTAVSLSDESLIIDYADEGTNVVVNPLHIAYSKLPQITRSLRRRRQSATVS